MANKKKFWQKRLVKIKIFLNLIFALVLIGLGAILIFWATYQNGWQFRPFQRDSKQIQETKSDFLQKPSKLYIPKLDRVLDVSDGQVENNRWTISNTGVSFLTTSTQPGKSGNSVIYGHNTNSVLGGLWRLSKDDFVYVVMDSGEIYKYRVFERSEVKPNQVEILKDVGDARLTIYTCSGFLDTARFVVVGKLI